MDLFVIVAQERIGPASSHLWRLSSSSSKAHALLLLESLNFFLQSLSLQISFEESGRHLSWSAEHQSTIRSSENPIPLSEQATESVFSYHFWHSLSLYFSFFEPVRPSSPSSTSSASLGSLPLFSCHSALSLCSTKGFAVSFSTTIAEEVALPDVLHIVSSMAFHSANTAAASAASEATADAVVPVLLHVVLASLHVAAEFVWLLHVLLEIFFLHLLLLVSLDPFLLLIFIHPLLAI